MMNSCKICCEETKPCFNTLVLKKYKVTYYKCVNCGFIQTESPFWLQEAYSSAITNQDIGLLSRNIHIAPILSLLISSCYNRNGKFIDYGGGYGILTRIMRDRGYQFFRYDTYCENIFAKDFDCITPSNEISYELLTAFEVFEHLTDPVSELENMLKWSTNIFFSTEIQKPEINSPNDWWYVMPETGQHIALYTIKSLSILANKYKLNLYTNGFNLHLFTRKKISPLTFKLILKSRIASFKNLIFSNKRSLLMTDYNSLLRSDFIEKTE